MPTLHNRTTKPGYCVRARPHGNNVTYQIKDRALEFYKHLEYSDGDELDWDLVWPLRELGDLYVGGGESSRTESDDFSSVGDSYLPDASDDELQALAQYVRSHPKYTPELRDEFGKGPLGDTLATLDDNSDPHSMSESDSGELTVQTGDEESLDQIVKKYFGHQQSDTDVLSGNNNTDSATQTINLAPDVVDKLEIWADRGWRDWNPEDHGSELADLSGLEDSVRDFADHPYSVSSFSWKDIPAYLFEIAENGYYAWYVDHRFNQREVDFTISVSLHTRLIEEPHNEVTLFTGVTDEYISNWKVVSDECSLKIDELKPSECHKFVHEQAEVTDLIVDFFDLFSDYNLTNQ